MSRAVELVDETDPRVADLAARLREFYRSTEAYDDFRQQGDKSAFWAPVETLVRRKVESLGRCRVLELGAGLSGFGERIADLGDRVEYVAQDLNPRLRPHLERRAHRVVIGEIRRLEGRFDVIFSTFVWEHLCSPRADLDHLLGLLAPAGSLFIASPRYDAPFYISPSARGRGLLRHLGTAVRLSWLRLVTALGGPPRFLIHLDPAVLHGDWYRDADAVHWPSWWDLRRHLGRELSLRRLRLESRGLKDWIWSRALLLFVRIDKPA